MKRIILLTSLLSAALLQVSCDANTPAFGPGGTNTTSTGVASRTNFTLGFSAWALDVFDKDYNFSGTSTEILVHTGDVNGVPVSGQTIQIRAQWGSLSAGSCISDANGDCSVTWTTSDNDLAPNTYCVRVVAYTTGEEAYYESNINDNDGLDDIDAGALAGNTAPFFAGFWDMQEPYMDHNHNGSYDAGIDINVDINGNDLNDSEDGEFNGANCNSTIATCSANTTTTIWQASHIDLHDEGKEEPVLTPPAPNICQ